MGDAPFTQKVRMLKAGMMETLLHGCVTWNLGQEHFAELRKLLLRIIGCQHRQRTDHLMSYAKTLEKAQCESVETTIRKGRLLFARGVQRMTNAWLTRRVMFGTMAGEENPGPGRPENNWAQCLADDLGVFQGTERSTKSSPLLFGVETVVMAEDG